MDDSGKAASSSDEDNQGNSAGELREQPSEILGDEPQEEHEGSEHSTVIGKSEWFYSSPIPPPAMLDEYGQIDPDFPKRILDRADKEQDHRHEMMRYEMETDRKALNHAANRTYLGQISAFLIAMTTISGSLWLMSQGHSWPGLAGVVFALAALTTVFVVGKRAEAVSDPRESDTE